MKSYQQIGNRTLAQINRENALRHGSAQDAQVLPKGQGASNVYSAGVSMGYSTMTGEGRSSAEGVWLTEFKNGNDERIWIGYSDKLRKYVYEK